MNTNLTPVQIASRKVVNERCRAHFVNDVSGKELGGSTPIEFVLDHLRGLNLEGLKLVISDSAYVYGLQNLCSLKDVWFFEHDGASPELRAWIRERVGAERILSYNELMTTKLKFNLIVGNPPFNGKSSIHLKIVGRLEHVCAKDGLISLILPKPILVRQSDRCVKYTSWMDTCSTVEWHDIPKSDFPSVSDDLVWFTVKNDGGSSMVDLTVKPPKKTWSAKYVTGLDFRQCGKKKSDDFPIPVINCVNDDGSPTFGKFTTTSALEKLKPYVGRPIIHVNGAGSMAARPEIAWLDETGEHPYYRHYMESLVFDSLDEARDAIAWIKSPEGKKYFSDWLKCGWGINTGLKLLIKPK
jgi:hypothetical protein